MDLSSLQNGKGTMLSGQWDGTTSTSGYLSIYSNTVWVATIAAISNLFSKVAFRLEKPYFLEVIKSISPFPIFLAKCIDELHFDSMITIENICFGLLLLFIHCLLALDSHVRNSNSDQKERANKAKDFFPTSSPSSSLVLCCSVHISFSSFKDA